MTGTARRASPNHFWFSSRISFSIRSCSSSSAVGVQAKNNFVDAFARGNVTSFNADGSVVAGSDVDGKQTREYMEYAAYIDKGVALGYCKP